MKAAYSILFLASLLVFSCKSTTKLVSVNESRKQIEQIMASQSQAWNRGDLGGFMEPYWKSDSLVFIGKNGPTYGWDKMLANYKKGYPTPEAMGHLTFTLLRTDAISADALFVIGKWHLKRSIGDVQGHFSLVFRKLGGKWVIVSDHSS